MKLAPGRGVLKARILVRSRGLVLLFTAHTSDPIVWANTIVTVQGNAGGNGKSAFLTIRRAIPQLLFNRRREKPGAAVATVSGEAPEGWADLAAAEDVIRRQADAEVPEDPDSLVPGLLRAVQQQAATLTHL